MKNMKRVFAILGVLALLSLVGFIIIGAATATPDSYALFQASIYSIIVVPIMLFAYIFIYRLVKKKNSSDHITNNMEDLKSRNDSDK